MSSLAPSLAGLRADPHSWRRLLRALSARIARDAAYLTAGLATSIIAMAVWVTAVTLTLTLAVFIVGIPVFIGAALAFRWAAGLDRRAAAIVDRRRLHARYRDHRGERLLVRLRTTAGDPRTWKDLAWLVTHSIVGFVFGTVAVTLIATVAGLAVLPAWYWALPEGAEFGLWTADSLGLACASALLALPLAAVTVGLVWSMARAEHAIAQALLDD